MDIYSKLLDKSEKVSIIGLGYVGMPLAIEFSGYVNVIGFDTNESKIKQYENGIDFTGEVGSKRLRDSAVEFTSDPKRLEEAIFHIVAVPTPINEDKTPNLEPVESASRIVGKHLKRGSTVVFESTVYPGVTEHVCLPILEQESGLVCGIDFNVGYSPERINPGDKIHTLKTIKKIVAGVNERSTNLIKQVYDLVIEAGTYPVSNIKTAEAIKVVENSQRDINIAFMNELAMVFDRMGIDTNEVVDGMSTKWNALGFRPGLVGGHCIGVDPYYFIYEAEKLGYHSQIILAGRKVNDGMGKFVVESTLKELIRTNQAPRVARIVICGLTFKEDCPDCRNSKVGDIINSFRDYGIETIVTDPLAEKEEAMRVYGVDIIDIDAIHDADCVIFAVAHSQYRDMSSSDVLNMFNESNPQKVIIDVKGILEKQVFVEHGMHYWSL